MKIQRLLFSLLLFIATAYAAKPIKVSQKSLEESYEIREQILNHPLFSSFLPHDFEGTDQFVDEFMMEYSWSKNKRDGGLIPVVIIPSLVGNQIQAKLSEAETVHWYCFNNADWYTIFMDETQFYPEIVNCFLSNFAMKRNQTGYYSAARKGVSYRIPGFGDTKTVEYLDEKKTSPIWSGIVNILKQVGYVEGKNVRAATYDWRVGPDGQREWYVQTKKLIEDTYAINGNKKVAVVSLSMGGPYFALFCQTVSQEWKDKFIQSYTSLSGAFGGSSVAAATLVMKFSQYGMATDLIGQIVQTWGSVPFLIPAEEIFKSLKIISIGGVDYYGSDMTKLLRDSNHTIASETFKEVKPFQKYSLKATGVRTNCIYGTDVPTAASFTSSSWTAAGEIGDIAPGDGTCLDEGLSICKTWGKDQKHPVFVYPIFNMTHVDVMENKEAISIFMKELGF